MSALKGRPPKNIVWVYLQCAIWEHNRDWCGRGLEEEEEEEEELPFTASGPQHKYPFKTEHKT